MINYNLPESVEVGDQPYSIRSDYRAVLDIFTALVDPELGDLEKRLVALNIFYKRFEDIPENLYQDALKKCFWFINGGREESEAGNQQASILNWEYDFPYIIAPINRVIGRDVRGDEYMHWWTFLAAFNEIGDCTLAQIVRIRKLKRQGKLKDKSDIAWYKQNKDLVDIPVKLTTEEENLLKKWGGGE